MIDHCAKVSYHQKQNVNTQDVLQLQTVVLCLSLKSFLSIIGSNLGRKSPSKTNDRKRLEDLVFPIDLKKKFRFKLFEMLKSFHNVR